ncbi:MAG TPA: membrane protein insertion efficiency factor YidD [Solirubrobacteraceae bacterium]
MVVAPMVLYQRVISPAIPQRCKYEPTCSRYAIAAVRRYGIWRGLVLAGWRLLRCNPWSHGGYDPVESQRVFGAGADERVETDAMGSSSQPSPAPSVNPHGPHDSFTTAHSA